MRRHGTYNYAFDNPIRFIDPDGMMPSEATGGEQSTGDQGGCEPGDPCYDEIAATALPADLLQIKHSVYNLFLSNLGVNRRATFVSNGKGGFETGFVKVGKKSDVEKAKEQVRDGLIVLSAAGSGGPAGILAKAPAFGATDEVFDAALEFHRIGGSSRKNLALSKAEKALDPPGISLLKANSPQGAANMMKREFPKMMEGIDEVASGSLSDFAKAGFKVKSDATRRFGDAHHRLIHPDGLKGFNAENMEKLAKLLKTTKIK